MNALHLESVIFSPWCQPSCRKRVRLWTFFSKDASGKGRNLAYTLNSSIIWAGGGSRTGLRIIRGAGSMIEGVVARVSAKSKGSVATDIE
jgi:hypothetical protein